MAENLVKWPSKRGPITKIMHPEVYKGDNISLVVGKWYDFHEVGCHLGNVGKYGPALIRVYAPAAITPGHD